VARYPELAQRYRHHYFARQHEVLLFEGTLQMLHALKRRHHWLAVATGKSRHGLDEALASVQLQGLFDATRTADETHSKPHPQMLLELMREFGCEPERTLMIGDTTHDLQLAANAGTPSVAVSYGAHQPEAFLEFEPLHVAHSTAELQGWLLQHA
jgi:phosphoglycolate phosphatase